MPPKCANPSQSFHSVKALSSTSSTSSCPAKQTKIAGNSTSTGLSVINNISMAVDRLEAAQDDDKAELVEELVVLSVYKHLGMCSCYCFTACFSYMADHLQDLWKATYYSFFGPPDTNS